MTHLAAITIAPAPQPPLDLRRTLELQAWCLFIDRWCDTGPDLMPFAAARRLLAKLTAAGLADVRGADVRAIAMLGVTARSRGSDHELLMSWRAAAFARIEGARP